MEDCGPEREPDFWIALSYSMDRFRARQEECDSFRLLGMQRARLDFDSSLLQYLSARFGRRAAIGAAFANLLAKFVLPLDASSCASSRERTAAAGIIPAGPGVASLRLCLTIRLFISITIRARGSIPRCWRR